MLTAPRTGDNASTDSEEETSSSSSNQADSNRPWHINSVSFTSSEAQQQLVDLESCFVHRILPVSLNGVSIAESDRLSSSASLYHILATCAESSALATGITPVYGGKGTRQEEFCAPTTWSVIWRVAVSAFNVTEGERPTVVFAAQRIVPSTSMGGAQELNVPLGSVSFEIDGVNLLVRESGDSSVAKVAAADKSVPEILAGRVLSWLPATAPDLRSSPAKNNGAKRSRTKDNPSDLTPSRIPPLAKRRRK